MAVQHVKILCLQYGYMMVAVCLRIETVNLVIDLALLSVHVGPGCSLAIHHFLISTVVS